MNTIVEQNQALELNQGRKVTLVLMNMIGSVNVRHVKLGRCLVREQGKLELRYTLKHHTKAHGVMVTNAVRMFSGWVEPANMKKSEVYSGTWSFDDFTSFDEELINVACKGLGTPFFEQ